MLLCCFKEPKQNNRRERDGSFYSRRSVDTPTGTPTAPPKMGVSATMSASRRSHGAKERAPLHKEEKRLLKQKSHESLRLKEANSLPYIDQSPRGRRTSGKSSSEIIDHVDIVRASSSCSSPSASASSMPPPSAKSTPNLPDVDSADSASVSPSPPVSPVRLSSSQKIDNSNNNNSKSVIVTTTTTASSSTAVIKRRGDDNTNANAPAQINRGMTRSSASYGIQQMLQEQIIEEERVQEEEEAAERRSKAAEAVAEAEKAAKKYEAIILELKEQHKQKIRELEQSFQTSLNNQKNTKESELKWQLSKYENDLADLKRNHARQLEQTKKHYEQCLREKDEQHEKVVKDYREKDHAWQEEKQDVLSEIQRLKEEANRFIAILSAEDEESDESLTPERRQTLTREVESLQLVVEMRTQELHRLREERARHLVQLEELEKTRSQLDRMQAKCEDLTVRLERKTAMERQLSLEKTNLESCYEAESKQKNRAAQQVEELQWRIKHKMELPPTKVYSPSSPSSFSSSFGSSASQPNTPMTPMTPMTPNTPLSTSTPMQQNQHHPPHHLYPQSHLQLQEVVEQRRVEVVQQKRPNSLPTTVAPPKPAFRMTNGSSNNGWRKEKEAKNALDADLWTPNNNSQPSDAWLATKSSTNSNNANLLPSNFPPSAERVGSKNDSVPAGSVTAEKEKAAEDNNSSSSSSSSSSSESEASHEDKDQHPDLSHLDSLEKLPASEDDDEEGGVQDANDCLSDEGLGDISSEASSPQPGEKAPNLNEQGGDAGVKARNSNSDEMIVEKAVIEDNCDDEKSPSKDDGDMEIVKKKQQDQLLASPVDERMPSRIPLSVQTNL